MAEPKLSPVAELVRQADPDLFLAALFAKEPLREQLMTLIAFDIELAKASRKSEPVIAAMRLQWWRDVVAEAAGGAAPREHEVAGPLARLIQTAGLAAETFDPLFAGYERETTAPFTAEGFDAWSRDRFGGFLRLAGALTGTESPALEAAGRAMALAFALRNARAMAGEGVYLLPLAGLDRAALARGETTEGIRAMVAERAGQAMENVRATRRGVPSALKPVLRLGWRSGPILRQALKPDLDLARDFLTPPGFGAARLLSLYLTGLW